MLVLVLGDTHDLRALTVVMVMMTAACLEIAVERLLLRRRQHCSYLALDVWL